MEQNLVAFLQNAAQRFGEKPALFIKSGLRYQTWTYQEIWTLAGKVAALLQQMGVQKGERVAIWAPNSPQWVFAFFGILRAGGIVLPLDQRSDEGFVARVVEKARPTLGFASHLTARAGAALGVKVILLENLEALVSKLIEPGLISVSTNDLAEIVFTSGTTGNPKGVMLSHRNILADLEAVGSFIPGASDYRVVSILPLSHMFEQTAGLFMPLSCGADITYLTSMQPAIILKTLRERRVVSMLLAPQILTLFMNGIEAEVEKKGMQKTWSSLQNLALQLPIWLRRLLFKEIHHRLGGSLKLIVVGGAALDPSQARKWTAMGIKVIQGYGTTETSPVITTHPLSKPAYDSAGLPLPGVAVKLAGDGEVLVKGDIVTPGYWEDPEQTAASFEEGWYKTGDIGFIDKNGFLHLSGRKKDLIVLPSGINVYPEDIEQVLNRHPGVIAAAVVGLKQGTQAHAALVLRDGSDMNEITRWANAQLSEHQHIQGATLWPDEDLPRTHTLKVKKHEIIKLIEANGSNVSETIKSPVVNKEPSVLGIIATLTQRPAADIHEHAKIGDDLGLDSLSRLDLLSTIESEFGVFVDEAFIGPSTTITELESFVLAGTKSKEEMQLRHWPLRLPICFVRRCLQSLVVFPIFRYYSRPTVIGLEHLKDITLPVLIVANHTSHFDSLAILNSLPPRFRHHTAVAAAKDYFFSRRNLAWFVSVVLNGFPFAREGALRPSLEYCAWLFDKGWSVLVYPEGTRSVTGKLGEFKSGTGLLATQMRVPVVPIRLEGLTAILPKGRTIPRRGHCIIHIGKPLFFNSQMSYEAVTMAVRTAIDQLGSFDNKGVQKL